MTAIDATLVTRLADLVALSLSELEKKAFAQDLNQILTHIARLDAVQAEALTLPLPAPLREDIAVSFSGREAALRAAPSLEGSAFRVPRAFLDPNK